MHKDYHAKTIPFSLFAKATAVLYHDGPFDYNIIKYDQEQHTISFIASPDFDFADEPSIEEVRTVHLTTQKMTRRIYRANPPIYHHKWLFVEPDYHGFDTHQSQQRSQYLEQVIFPLVSKKKIGYKKQWHAILSQKNTRLNKNSMPSPLLRQAIHELEIKGKRVLDFGAGNLRNSILLAAENRVISYDPFWDDQDLNYCRTKIGPRRCKTHLNSQQSQKFHFITANFVLNVVDEPATRQQILRDIAQLLKPMGTAFIEVRKNVPSETWTRYKDGFLTGKHTFQKEIGEDELRQLLDQACLHPLKMTANSGAFAMHVILKPSCKLHHLPEKRAVKEKKRS